ncbi:MAG: L,D-transpeptidase [Chthoniobacterales bacterium]
MIRFLHDVRSLTVLDVKKSGQTSIHVSIADQRLRLKRGARTTRSFPVSTSRFGNGTDEGSMKTPLGRFRIAEKIGAEMPPGTVFKGRKPMDPSITYPRSEDLILTRILWLDGLDRENANTLNRFIYIHGTIHEDKIGKPASHGCIRMREADLLHLFDHVEVDTPVVIER